jgi:D-3-phosphoglycerate dehydrogenase
MPRDDTVPAISMKPLTVLATGPNAAAAEFEPLRAAGLDLVIGRPLDAPDRRPWSEADLIEAVRAADIVLASHLELISRPVLSAAERLQLVIVPFIGVDKIDVPVATELGVLVANSPTPENFVAVAEATVALILMLQKRVKHNEAKLRRGAWAQRDDRGEFLFGKTVGLVGLGRVGARVARRLAGWDVRLIAADPYVDPARAAELGVTLVDLSTLLAESDVVSLHPSLTDETRRMIGEKELRRMKPTAVLINTARGEVADEDAVTRAVDERWIAGAALDAFTKEPLPAESPPRRVDPEILALARGEVPAHVFNPDAIARWRVRRG